MPESPRLFDNASAEFQLVAACCRWRLSPARIPAVQQLAQRPLQWSRVLFLAQRHRVSSLVADAVSSLKSLPPEIAAALVLEQRKTLLCNMLSLRALTRLTELFRSNSVPFIVLKGLPLALQAYGNLALRHSRDIDILIDRWDVVRVDDLLRSIGYVRLGLDADMTAAQEELWIGSRKHFDYRHGLEGVRLEVHWRTTDNRHLLHEADSVDECEQVSLAEGLQVPVLRRAKLLLNLMVHGAGHAWFRLKWIADVAALLAQQSAQDREQLSRLAHQQGLERVFEQALHLCDALFAENYAESFQSPSRPTRTLIDIAAAALLEEDLTAPTAFADYVPRHLILSHLLLRSGWRYRCEELRMNLVAPSDWQVLRLPQGFQWLYPLLRVPLWTTRRFFAKTEPLDRR